MNPHVFFRTLASSYIQTLMLTLALWLAVASAAHAALQTFDDKATFLTATAAGSATGPLPDLGTVATLDDPTASATVGSITFSMGLGAVDLYIGGNGLAGLPTGDWYPPTPGNDIAQGVESLQVQTEVPVFALGFDFVEPSATTQPWGGEPVDSIYEVVLYAGTTEVGRFTFNAPDDKPAFVGVWSDVAFDRVTIVDTTGSNDDEYIGEFYTGVQALPCSGEEAVCTVDNKDVFLAATNATAATGVDANGEPLPLPDLGDVTGRGVTIGDVTIRGSQLVVGTRDIAGVVNNDWTLLLPGPDIALTGNGPMKRLEIRFAQPVYAAGIEVVEPQNGPNVGRRFSDATFTVELKRRNQTIRELAFSPPNDVPTFLGLWSDLAFDHISIRSVQAFGTKIFGKTFSSATPVLSTRLPDILVVDADAGTNRQGALFRVSAVDGFRTVLNNFGDAQQGFPGRKPFGVAVEANSDILVIDQDAGTGRNGVLFRVNLITKVRLPLSDFGDSSKGPLGAMPSGVAIESSGQILVTDFSVGTGGRGALFRVNAGNGTRALLSDFGQGQNQGQDPIGVAVEANGTILVVDPNAGTGSNGALFRVNRTNGNRTLLSDFGSFNFGPLGMDPVGVAVEANGTILVVDPNAGTNFRGALFRVSSVTGLRSVLADFGNPGQGQALGTDPVGVTVEASGNILIVEQTVGLTDLGGLFRVNASTGFRTLLSFFGDPGQGPLGRFPQGVAVLRR
jgi:hypothetical protein